MEKVLLSVTAADWRVEAQRTRNELFWVKLDRSHISRKHLPATLHAREEVTTEMCNGEGISPALAWPCSTAAFLLHKLCNKQERVCLFMGASWEPNWSQARASAPPDAQTAKFISSLLVGVRPHPTPAGCRCWLTNHPELTLGWWLFSVFIWVLWFRVSSVAGCRIEPKSCLKRMSYLLVMLFIFPTHPFVGFF